MFFISVFLVLVSSYFLLSVLYEKMNFKKNLGFILFLLIAFAQVILTFEFLSILKAISISKVLFINTIFFVFFGAIWLKNGRNIIPIGIKQEIKSIKKALKSDKLLLFSFLCFIVFIISELIIALFFPIRYGDALGYYLSRCTAWIQNMSISHYITYDSRELIMPVNSELLYTWVLLFLKNEIGIAFFPFLFYINSIWVIYNFLGELGFCRRKRLWTVIVYSSLALVYIQASIPGGDLWVGSLILTSIYLFYSACKYNKKSLIFFASLSYAIALGIKTTAIIAFPMSLLLIILISFMYNREKMKKYLSLYILFGFITFVFFSSYNYILNMIDYHNPVSDNSQLLINQFRGGFKGYLTNLIRYTFVIFDFSGIIDILGFGNFIETLQDKVFVLIGETRDSYTSLYFGNYFKYNQALGIADSFLGLMGLLAFFPSVLYSIIYAVKKRYSKRTILLASLALFYIFNILIFARVMVFTRFNMRYLLAFVIVAAPVIVYTYIRKNSNIYKMIMVWFLFIYLAFTSHAKPLMFIKGFIKQKSLPVEYQIKDRSFILADCDEFRIRNYFLGKNRAKIGIIIEQTETNPIYYIEKLRLDGFQIDTILPEIISLYDLSGYTYIIGMKKQTASTIIKNFKEHKKDLNKAYCAYKDYEENIIMPEDNTTPVIVSCDLPFLYLEENGFVKEQDIYLEDYIIFKK